MDQKIYHGNLQPVQVAQTLAGQFQRGSLRVKIYGESSRAVIQIGTSARPMAGGQTDLSVIVQQVEDGISVQVGQQNYLGVVASLGASAYAIFRNPLNILGRINDITTDIQLLQLTQEVWTKIEAIAAAANATTQLSERLRTTACGYCNAANPPGTPRCLACGAPLGDVQPQTCPHCGYVVLRQEKACPNCHAPI